MKKNKLSTVYFVLAPKAGKVKIGRTDRSDVDKRVKAIQGGCPEVLKLLFVLPTTSEKLLHKKFQQYRSHGEWFALKGNLLTFVKEQQIKELGDLLSTTVKDGQFKADETLEQTVKGAAKILYCGVPPDESYPALLEKINQFIQTGTFNLPLAKNLGHHKGRSVVYALCGLLSFCNASAPKYRKNACDLFRLAAICSDSHY